MKGHGMKQLIIILTFVVLFVVVADAYAITAPSLTSPNYQERKEAFHIWTVMIVILTFVIIAIVFLAYPMIVLLIIPSSLTIGILYFVSKGGGAFVKICLVSILVLIIIALLLPTFFFVRNIINKVRYKKVQAITRPYLSQPFNNFQLHRSLSQLSAKIGSFNLPQANPYDLFQASGYPSSNKSLIITLYHGTPLLENARDIVNGKGTFVIGSGNANGTGLYIADFNTAKGFAKASGAIIKVKLQAPWNQIVDYNKVSTSFQFLVWGINNGNGDEGDNITDYTLSVLKKRFIRVKKDFYVALAPKTDANERVVFQGITVLGLLDANGNSLQL